MVGFLGLVITEALKGGPPVRLSCVAASPHMIGSLCVEGGTSDLLDQ